MQRFVTISFIAIHLLSATITGELLKLPFLIHHYLEHKAKEPDESIVQFLREHYDELHAALSQHHENDHKHLPLKIMDGSYLSSSISLVPNISLDTELFVFQTITVNAVARGASTYSHFLADIWQPPRS